jgi:hypothetical protein
MSNDAMHTWEAHVIVWNSRSYQVTIRLNNIQIFELVCEAEESKPTRGSWSSCDQG